MIAGVDIMHEWIVESGRSTPSDIGLARPQIVENKMLSGIRYNHESLGATAVDLVAGQIYNNETNKDDSSKRSVIQRGKWNAGLVPDAEVEHHRLAIRSLPDMMAEGIEKVMNARENVYSSQAAAPHYQNEVPQASPSKRKFLRRRSVPFGTTGKVNPAT